VRLLEVCRQIHAEAAPIPFSSNVFCFGDWFALDHFVLNWLVVEQRRAIEDARIESRLPSYPTHFVRTHSFTLTLLTGLKRLDIDPDVLRSQNWNLQFCFGLGIDRVRVRSNHNSVQSSSSAPGSNLARTVEQQIKRIGFNGSRPSNDQRGVAAARTGNKRSLSQYDIVTQTSYKNPNKRLKRNEHRTEPSGSQIWTALQWATSASNVRPSEDLEKQLTTKHGPLEANANPSSRLVHYQVV
jgi:hypothetical protein